jgi:hypothetical protein
MHKIKINTGEYYKYIKNTLEKLVNDIIASREECIHYLINNVNTYLKIEM